MVEINKLNNKIVLVTFNPQLPDAIKYVELANGNKFVEVIPIFDAYFNFLENSESFIVTATQLEKLSYSELDKISAKLAYVVYESIKTAKDNKKEPTIKKIVEPSTVDDLVKYTSIKDLFIDNPFIIEEDSETIDDNTLVIDDEKLPAKVKYNLTRLLYNTGNLKEISKYFGYSEEELTNIARAYKLKNDIIPRYYTSKEDQVILTLRAYKIPFKIIEKLTNRTIESIRSRIKLIKN